MGLFLISSCPCGSGWHAILPSSVCLQLSWTMTEHNGIQNTWKKATNLQVLESTERGGWSEDIKQPNDLQDKWGQHVSLENTHIGGQASSVSDLSSRVECQWRFRIPSEEFRNSLISLRVDSLLTGILRSPSQVQPHCRSSAWVTRTLDWTTTANAWSSRFKRGRSHRWAWCPLAGKPRLAPAFGTLSGFFFLGSLFIFGQSNDSNVENLGSCSLRSPFWVNAEQWVLTFSCCMCFSSMSSLYALLAKISDWNGRLSFLMATFSPVFLSMAELWQT